MSKALRKEVNQLTKVIGELKMVKSKNAPRSRRRNRRKASVNNLTARTVAPPSSGSVVVARNRIPRMVTGMNNVVIQNTERVVALGTAQTFPANAATLDVMPYSFPWLNGIAINFSKFRLLHVEFIYIPVCPTSTSGSFAMAFSYDTNDTAVSSMSNLQTQYHSVTSPYWGGFEGSAAINSDNFVAPSGAVISKLDISRLDKVWYKYITPAESNAMTAAVRSSYIPATLWYGGEGGPVVSIGGGIIFAKYRVELIEPIVSSAQ